MSQQLSMVFGVAFATGSLNLSQLWRSASSLGLADFQLTLFLAGAVTLLAALSFPESPLGRRRGSIGAFAGSG